jgi:hypothetical protein
MKKKNALPSTLKTFEDISNLDYKPSDFEKYQPQLTIKLDNSIGGSLDQNLLNEIVLWKTNRFVSIEHLPIELLNSPKIQEGKLDKDFTSEILHVLLSKSTHGIRLPMASTILRFRNPKVYQIIDQRAYRFAGLGTTLKLQTSIEKQINIYLEYLDKLREISESKAIPFEIIDRLFYLKDKEVNSEHLIKS